MFNSKDIKGILGKTLTWNSKPTEESFPELPEVLLWMRFFIGIAYGSYLGLKGVTSPSMVLQLFNLVAFIPVMYSRFYLGIDSEAFGMKIIFSGLLNAVALAFLLWVYFFTAAHEAEEMQLEALLVSDSVKAATDAAIDEIIPEETVVGQASEF